jgi:hypothetical protein
LKCWARILGSCDRKSREHVITKGLWKGPQIHVQGFDWCRTESKAIGVEALTAKVLCRHHNSALSQLDSSAITAFDSIRAAADLGRERESATEGRGAFKKFVVDGLSLERWFLKTLLGVYVAQKRIRLGASLMRRVLCLILAPATSRTRADGCWTAHHFALAAYVAFAILSPWRTMQARPISV